MYRTRFPVLYMDLCGFAGAINGAPTKPGNVPHERVGDSGWAIEPAQCESCTILQSHDMCIWGTANSFSCTVGVRFIEPAFPYYTWVPVDLRAP
jgi:hypothetical protein